MGRSNVYCKGQGKRLCCSCGEQFKPHVRLKERQVSCGKGSCKAKRHHQTLKTWRRKTPGYNKKRQYPDGFWQAYRRNNPTSTNRNRAQAKLRARLKRKSLQRNFDILQVAKFPRQSEAFSMFATLHRSSILRDFGKENSS
jgi:hypothetical protein